MIINLQNDHHKKVRNASFSNKIRKDKYILSDEGDNLSDEDESAFIKQNDENRYSMDYNSFNISNNITRKTIEMEYINKTEKNP